MHSLTIVAANKTGLLVELTTLLANNGINIQDIHAEAHGNEAVFQFNVDRHEDTLRVLSEEDFHLVTDDSLLIRLSDKPVSLATVTQRLAANGIDIRAIRHGLRNAESCVVSVTCDNNDKAREILPDILLR